MLELESQQMKVAKSDSGPVRGCHRFTVVAFPNGVCLSDFFCPFHFPYSAR